MPYNFSGMEGQTTIIGALQSANSFTNNLWGIFMLAAVGLTVFFSLRRENSNRASFAAATFVTSIISVFFAMLGLVTPIIPGACIILLCMAAAALIMEQ